MRKSLSIILLLLIVYSLSSCDNYDEIGTDKDNNVLLSIANQKLFAMGFDTLDTYLHHNYFVVEGDILIHQDSILNYVATRQYYVNNRVDNGQTITIGVATVGMLQYWASAIGSVASIYTQNTGLDMHFDGYNPNADIVLSYISDDDLYACAYGEFPGTDGKPGKHVRINSNFYANINTYLDLNQKIFLLMHEIGHNLGLRHSNYMYNWEGVGDEGANLIPGTPVADENSYMKAGTCSYSWSGISDYDAIMLRYLFPYIYTIHFENTSLDDIRYEYSANGYVLSREYYPVKGQLTFRGWYNDPYLNSEFDYNSALNSDRTLYPSWESPTSIKSVTCDSYDGITTETLTLPETSVVTLTSTVQRAQNSWAELRLYDDTYTEIVGDDYSETFVLTDMMQNQATEQFLVYSKSLILKSGTYTLVTSLTSQLGLQSAGMGKHGHVSLKAEYK